MYEYYLLLDSCLGGCEAGDGYAERRATNVVETGFVAELNGRGFAAVFAANAALEVGTGVTALFYGHIDKLAYAVLVEHLEGVYLQNLLFKVNRQEAGDVVARITEGHLREVVRTEAEIFGAGSNLVGREGSTRNFNHRTNLERNFNADRKSVV